MRLSIWCLLGFICLSSAVVVSAQSQLGTGAISGLVQDQNGAIIFGAAD